MAKNTISDISKAQGEGHSATPETVTPTGKKGGGGSDGDLES